MGKLFADIRGQKPAITMLTAQLKTGDLSHAYLFLGEEGSGKTFLAHEFAKYILCADPTEKTQCENCKKFKFGSHPDFIWINGEEGIKIEQIREVTERIHLSPALSKRKVLVVSNAEQMGVEAANAFLKTIEEPPLDSVIILTAISEKSLPQTIVSRVQRVKLLPLNTDDLIEIIQKDSDENISKEVARYAEGSLGEAKKLMADPGELKLKKDLFGDVINLLNNESIIDKFKIIEDHEKKKTLKSFFRVYAYVIAQSLQEEILGKDCTHDLKLGLPEKVKLIEKILKTQEELEYNVSLRLALEEMVLESKNASFKRS